MALTFGNLCSGLQCRELTGNQEIRIENITADSRRAGPATVFVAVPGTGGDGHDYVADVVARGCRALVIQTDRRETVSLLLKDYAGATAVVDRTRPVPALLGRILHGQPDLELWTAAVTGTNGKTTVSFLLREMLNRLRGPCGLLGTVAYADGSTTEPAPLTTPPGTVFYSWLARMVANGCRSVAMELSSHGLDQERCAGLGLDVAIMTNMGRDHLDYHDSPEDYLAAKALIMKLLRKGAIGEGTGRPGVLVLNGDDPQLAGLDTSGVETVRFSCRPDQEQADRADLRVSAAHLELEGTRLELDWRGQGLKIKSPLVGRFNVENLTAALAGGIALGLDAEACAAALGGVPQVPGRLERFVLPNGGLAVVDYAHTHDALAAVLRTCDELKAGRLLVVFGCGGDRDRGKRPLMGRVAAQESDLAWITSDNPRSEEPGGICRDILAGFDEVADPRARARAMVIDRREAIEKALAETGAGDILVVAGKGHEDYQLIGGRTIDLDDRVIIREWMERNRDYG
ncbi:MAG: UDP-N-acetylmuramoyl-L-alanyl-D-glutamate--2,6-diaminopimelate ligase [Candidatus Krumholzibacteriota bacterium]